MASIIKADTLQSTTSNVFVLNSAGTEYARFDSSGNVGIGGALLAGTPGGSAGKVFSLAATQYPQTISTATDATAGNKNVRWIYRDSGVFQLQTLDDTYGSEVTAYEVQRSTTGITYQAWSTGAPGSNAERMRITSAGDFIVGTTAEPTGSTGGSAFMASSVGRRVLIMATTTTGAANLAEFANPNGRVGSISTSGSATSYVTSSDYRLKNTIAPMTGALATVALLKPVTYKWNVDGSDGQGFIAHELQEVVEGCVTGAKDAVDADGNPQYQGVDTSFLVATLTAAIQELKVIVDAQAVEIAALKAK